MQHCLSAVGGVERETFAQNRAFWVEIWPIFSLYEYLSLKSLFISDFRLKYSYIENIGHISTHNV